MFWFFENLKKMTIKPTNDFEEEGVQDSAKEEANRDAEVAENKHEVAQPENIQQPRGSFLGQDPQGVDGQGEGEDHVSGGQDPQQANSPGQDTVISDDSSTDTDEECELTASERQQMVQRQILRNNIINNLLSCVAHNEHLSNNLKLKWFNTFNQNQDRLFESKVMMRCRVDNLTSYSFNGSELFSLYYENQYVVDGVLDLIIGLKCKDTSVQYIETSVTKMISITREGIPEFKEDKERVMGVFNYNNHWIFFMLCKATRTIYIIDPLVNGIGAFHKSLGDHLLQWFAEINHKKEGDKKEEGEKNEAIKYAGKKSRDVLSCDPEPTSWNFEEFDWSVECINHDTQKDVSSCGLFCMEFAHQLAREGDIPDKLNVDEDVMRVRRKHFATLLESVDGELLN